jgi:2-polyprenyl-3-methyl-5-hydroxy-6-metoxy-1,4-benzoquinol methylase
MFCGISGAEGSMPDDYTREEVPCNICGTSNEEFLFYAPERIVRCKTCGLMYNNPRLDAASLEKMYTREYFQIDGDDYGVDYKAYADYIGDEVVIVRSMLRRMRKVEKYAASKGTVLDVGCATGFSLIAAQKLGWEAHGIEYSDFCVNFARSRGLNVHQGSLDTYESSDESFDAITMWDYLEHSSDPRRELTRCREMLKGNGVIVLSIPNVDSWSFPVFKKKWIGFKNIEHFYYYSRDTISKLATLAGLSMVDSFYHGKYLSLSFFLSRVQYYVPENPLLRLIEKCANLEHAKKISFYFNPFDILNVVLQKK